MAALRVALGLVYGAAFVAVFTVVPGRWDWTEGWVYLAVLGVGQSASTAWVARRNREVLRRRGRIGEGTKRWDIAWLAGFAVLVLATFAVAALDSGRNRWSSMPTWLWLAGLGLHVVFPVGLAACMTANPHFEKTVRIQTDRDHRVVDSGPYRLVRHPGYVVTAVGFLLATPLMLRSWWAFVPAAATVAWLILRTALEDRTLRRELEGYEEYAARTRWRLLPGVW